MKWEKKAARKQAGQRAEASGGRLQVFKVCEYRELPESYYAATSREHAIVMALQSYRPWPRPWQARGNALRGSGVDAA